MKKIFVIFGLLFAIPCFATGVSGNSGTCDSGALGTDGGSTILRANYEPETIHLRWYDENNNLLTVNSASQSCTYGDSITIPTAPTKTGYRFTGWSVFSDYTPIEYIESTGTQYIDTGYLPNNNTKVEIKANLLNDSLLFGALETKNSVHYQYSLYSYESSGAFYYTFGRDGYQDRISDTLPLFSTDYVFITEKNVLNINGVSYDTKCGVVDCRADVVFDIPYTMYLFARNRNGSADASAVAKIYYVKIWDNGTLVRDFIPVKDINGVACMYDKVSGQFFYNQGTGNFIAGPNL